MRTLWIWLGFAVILGGCSASSTTPTASPASAVTEAATAAPAAASTATPAEPTAVAPTATVPGVAETSGAEVAIMGLAFRPATIEVPAGTTVRFTNTDSSVHTVTAGTPQAVGDAFDQELDGPGATADVTLDQPGAQRYFCRIHPFMRGEIVAL